MAWLIVGLLVANLILAAINWRKIVAFTDSMATLTTDVNKLIAEGGPGAVAAAVAAKDAADAAAVDALDATVKQALTPPTV